jgi:hypothetical protein
LAWLQEKVVSKKKELQGGSRIVGVSWADCFQWFNNSGTVFCMGQPHRLYGCSMIVHSPFLFSLRIHKSYPLL